MIIVFQFHHLCPAVREWIPAFYLRYPTALCTCIGKTWALQFQPTSLVYKSWKVWTIWTKSIFDLLICIIQERPVSMLFFIPHFNSALTCAGCTSGFALFPLWFLYFLRYFKFDVDMPPRLFHSANTFLTSLLRNPSHLLYVFSGAFRKTLNYTSWEYCIEHFLSISAA